MTNIKQTKEDKVREFFLNYNLDLDDLKSKPTWDCYTTRDKNIRKDFRKEFNRGINKNEFKTQIIRFMKYPTMFDYRKDYIVRIHLEDYYIDFVRKYIWLNMWSKPITNLGRRYEEDRVEVHYRE